jgi:hypothetical protein
MINALFGFRGRLGRLAFLGWNLAAMVLVGAIAVAFLVLGAGLAAVGVPSGGAKILGVLTAVVAAARDCIDRQEQQEEPRWYREPEWLVVTPRLPRQVRPMLDIASTEAALNGLLFFDADRKLSENTPSDAARRKQ